MKNKAGQKGVRTPTWGEFTLTSRIAGTAIGAIIAIFGIVGVVALSAEGELAKVLRWFHLDRELTVVAFFSAGLLVAAGCLAWHLNRTGILGGKLVGVLALFLVFMGFDELLKIHETSEKLTKLDWQIVYLPLILAGGLGWTAVWWRTRGLARVLWTVGAAAWATSQLLEAAQWGWWAGDGSVKATHYNLMMVTEELLEMGGTALFLVALMRVGWPDGMPLRVFRLPKRPEGASPFSG